MYHNNNNNKLTEEVIGKSTWRTWKQSWYFPKVTWKLTCQTCEFVLHYKEALGSEQMTDITSLILLVYLCKTPLNLLIFYMVSFSYPDREKWSFTFFFLLFSLAIQISEINSGISFRWALRQNLTKKDVFTGMYSLLLTNSPFLLYIS